jgi:hypothetical protein
MLAFTYSSRVKMEAIFSSETSVVFERITRRHMPEDINRRSYSCENLKSFIPYSLDSCLVLLIICVELFNIHVK